VVTKIVRFNVNCMLLSPQDCHGQCRAVLELANKIWGFTCNENV